MNKRYSVYLEVSADPEAMRPGVSFESLDTAEQWARSAIAEKLWGARRADICDSWQPICEGGRVSIPVIATVP